MSFGAVALLSGGLDSSTCLAVARAVGYRPLFTLSVAYGQRHVRELEAAKQVSAYYDAEHFVVGVSLAMWGGSALTDSTIPVPAGRGLKEMAMEVPVTYVPARNTVLLALAASLAEAKGVHTIFFGATQIDYSGYPDCRREFLGAMTRVLDLGTKSGTEEGAQWKIETPLLMLGKKAIIQRGLELGVPYQLTWSCYLGQKRPCEECDSCRLRAAGFAELGMSDPLLAA